MKYRLNDIWSLCKSIYDLGMFINFSYIINKNRNLYKLKNNKSFFPRKLIDSVLHLYFIIYDVIALHFNLYYLIIVNKKKFYSSQDPNNFLLRLLFFYCVIRYLH